MAFISFFHPHELEALKLFFLVEAVLGAPVHLSLEYPLVQAGIIGVCLV